MTENTCGIVRDLLPLYIDGTCGAESRALVTAHLEGCEQCRTLRDQMSAPLSAELAEEYDGSAGMKKAFWSILWIILAAVAVVSCYSVNLNLALWGGNAGGVNLLATVLYVIFWGVFTVITRNIRPMARFNFLASGVSLVMAGYSLLCRLLHTGGFISGFIAFPVAVPMQGVLLFTDWTGLYGIAAALDLLWLAFNWLNLRRLKRVWN